MEEHSCLLHSWIFVVQVPCVYYVMNFKVLLLTLSCEKASFGPSLIICSWQEHTVATRRTHNKRWQPQRLLTLGFQVNYTSLPMRVGTWLSVIFNVLWFPTFQRLCNKPSLHRNSVKTPQLARFNIFCFPDIHW